MNHTATPWKVGSKYPCRIMREDRTGNLIATTTMPADEGTETEEEKANAAFIVQACNSHEELFQEASLLRCLASSPRFQTMTVKAALDELALNGMPHDQGRAIAKAEGRA